MSEHACREVRFEGATAGSGPLTWAQREMLVIMRELPGAHQHFNINLPVELPPGTTLDQVEAGLRRVVLAHDTLRTTVFGAAGDPGARPEQRVRAAGIVPMYVHEITESGEAQEQIAEQVSLAARATQIGYEDEPTIRVDLLRRGDANLRLLVTVNHLMLDGFGIQVLRDEILRCMSGEGERPASPTPLERAATEASESGAARSKRSLTQLGRTLAAAPPCLLPLRGASDSPPGERGQDQDEEAAPFWLGRVLSPALGPALQKLSRSLSLPASALVMAAAGTLLARRAERTAFAALIISSNRFSASLRPYMGAIFQAVPITVEIGDSGLFDTAVQVARAASGAGVAGQFDPDAYHTMLRQIEIERGAELMPLPAFNIQDSNLAFPELSNAEIKALAAKSWHEYATFRDIEESGLYLNTWLQRGVLELAVRVRTERCSPADARELILAVERWLIACVDGDTPAPPPDPEVPQPRFARLENLYICGCAHHRAADHRAGHRAGHRAERPVETREAS